MAYYLASLSLLLTSGSSLLLFNDLFGLLRLLLYLTACLLLRLLRLLLTFVNAYGSAFWGVLAFLANPLSIYPTLAHLSPSSFYISF